MELKLFKAAAEAFFPNTCASCGEITREGELLCEYCFEMLERVSPEKSCIKCGLPKKNCACSRYAFCFEGCTAPFYFGEYSKRAMYAFKFGHNRRAGRLLAREMALAVRQRFPDITFDFVAFVPMLKRSRLKRGYNQSEVLAKELSEILGLPLAVGLLGCRPKAHVQHRLPNKMRFDNVKDKYFCRNSVMGKSILLVDDIKTTGATLEECAKQLKRSGAARVYCVTGLITKNKENKEKSE